MTWTSIKSIIPLRIAVPVRNLHSYSPKNISKVDVVKYPHEYNNLKIENSAKNCPYKGLLVAKAKQVIFGFSVPNTTVLGSINDSWEVTAADNSKGWIDRAGQIHKGTREPSNIVLKNEEIIGKIVNNELVMMGIKVGKLIPPTKQTSSKKQGSIKYKSKLGC